MSIRRITFPVNLILIVPYLGDHRIHQPTIDLIYRYFYVRPPETTPYADLPPGEALTLYYAPGIPGIERLKGRVCP